MEGHVCVATLLPTGEGAGWGRSSSHYLRRFKAEPHSWLLGCPEHRTCVSQLRTSALRLSKGRSVRQRAGAPIACPRSSSPQPSSVWERGRAYCHTPLRCPERPSSQPDPSIPGRV